MTTWIVASTGRLRGVDAAVSFDGAGKGNVMLFKGFCLCRSVAFEADGPLRDVVACHCSQCRRISGHFWAATSAPLDRFRITSDAGLAWFRSSDAAERGFCRTCGSSLFWKPAGEDRMSFAAGAIEGATGLRIASHIHREDAGDYYSPEGPPPGPGDRPDKLHGSCLCGACQFTLPGPAGEIIACHCRQCRKLSGHYSASFDADEAALAWTAQTALAEFQTPGGGQRGHCTRCGSSLFFRAADGNFSVEAGAITGATGGTLGGHIFTGAKGDYYDIDDGLPQAKTW